MPISMRPAPAWLAAALLAAACSGGGDTPVVPRIEAADPSVPPVAADPVEGRVVVLVVPGVDPDLVERWRSDLPGFERFTPGRNMPRLLVDAPYHVDHAAAQLATGRRAGAHGSFGGAYLDTAAMVARPSAARPAVEGAEPFWVTAANAGIKTRALWVPGPLPADPPRNLYLLPDVLPASVPAHSIAILTPGGSLPVTGDIDVAVRLEGEPPWTAEVALPEGGPWTLQISAPRPDAYRITAGAVTADVTVGELGAPVTLPLPDGAAAGAVQVRLAAARAGGGVVLGLLSPGRSPGPGQAVTSPPGFAEEWARYHDAVDTTGGGQAVLEAMRSGFVGPDMLVRELNAQLDSRTQALLGELGRRDARLVVAWLPEAGLAGEAFLGLGDSGHPGWSGELAARYGGAAKSAVARLDGAISQVREALQPGDRMLVVSDIGMASQRKHVDLNAALAEAGLLRLQDGVDRSIAPTLEQAARWEATTAYATGPGLVYLNLQGREALGSVSARLAGRELARVRAALAGLKDGKQAVLTAVQPGSEALAEAPEELRPDFVVTFAPGYGPAPTMVAGRVGAQAVAPNLSGVTGGFGGATPREAAGFVVTTFGEVEPEAHVVDVAPTVLRLLGVEAPRPMPGKIWALAGAAPEVAPVTPPPAAPDAPPAEPSTP